MSPSLFFFFLFAVLLLYQLLSAVHSWSSAQIDLSAVTAVLRPVSTFSKEKAKHGDDVLKMSINNSFIKELFVFIYFFETLCTQVGLSEKQKQGLFLFKALKVVVYDSSGHKFMQIPHGYFL